MHTCWFIIIFIIKLHQELTLASTLLERNHYQNGGFQSVEEIDVVSRNSRETKKEETIVYPTREQLYRELLENLRVQHCFCPGGYLIEKNKCVSHAVNVTVLDGSAYSPWTVPSSDIAWRVGQPNCTGTKQLIQLPDTTFGFLPNGILLLPDLGLGYSHKHYCVDFVTVDGNNSNQNHHTLPSTAAGFEENNNAYRVVLQANVCVKNTVPRCCSERISNDYDNATNTSSSCELPVTNVVEHSRVNNFSVESVESVPHIKLGKVFLKWNYELAPFTKLNCSDDKEVTSFPIMDYRKHFHHARSGAMLHLRVTKDEIFYLEHDEFCINKDTHNQIDEYTVSFCHDPKAGPIYETLLQKRMLRKCCPRGHVYDKRLNKCVATKHQSTVWISELVEGIFKFLEKRQNNSENLSILHPVIYSSDEDHSNIPTKFGFPLSYPLACEEEEVDANVTSLLLKHNRSHTFLHSFLESDNYCLDTFLLPIEKVSIYS